MARPRAWADLIFSASIAPAAKMTPLDILFDLDPNPIDTITVTRIVADLHGFIEMPDPQVEGISGIDVGIGVCSKQAFDLGVTAVPDPAVSTDYPPRGWLYVATHWVAESAGAATLQNGIQPSWHVDVGAMRKIDKGILFIAAALRTIDGESLTVRFGGRVRALCLT